jgi:multimeric flavodoxin WrbA
MEEMEEEMVLTQRVLVILGSPRRNGNSAILAHQVAEGARHKGAIVESFYLNGLNLKPCQGCERCQQDDANGCAVDDDMHRIYPVLRESDSIVIASPVYWFNISAQTKLFIDRLFAVGVGKKNLFAGKRFVIILTYGDADPFVSGAVNALRSFQDMFRYLDATIEGILYGTAFDAGEIRNNADLMERAYLLGNQLATGHLQE